MEMHWGFLIVLYLFLGGLGAGAYLASFAAEKGYLGNVPGLDRAGYLIAAPAVAIGSLLLVFDLGQGFKKPWLIINMLANFSSVMTWGVYILSAFIIVGLVPAYSAWKKEKTSSNVASVGAALALATGAYTGLLIAVVEAVPFWNSYLMPFLFLASALSTGLSASVLLAHYLEKGEAETTAVDKSHFYIMAVEFVLAVLFIGMATSGAQGAMAMVSAKQLISGSFSLVFWVFFIAIGLVTPLAVFAHNTFRPQKLSSTTVLTSDVAVLIGGFALRYVIIMAAMPAWTGTLI